MYKSDQQNKQWMLLTSDNYKQTKVIESRSGRVATILHRNPQMTTDNSSSNQTNNKSKKKKKGKKQSQPEISATILMKQGGPPEITATTEQYTHQHIHHHFHHIVNKQPPSNNNDRSFKLNAANFKHIASGAAAALDDAFNNHQNHCSNPNHTHAPQHKKNKRNFLFNFEKLVCFYREYCSIKSTSETYLTDSYEVAPKKEKWNNNNFKITQLQQKINQPTKPTTSGTHPTLKKKNESENSG